MNHLYIGKPAYLYEEANPDWAPSLDLGYSTAPPDESRHARYLQRSIRRQKLLSSQDGECEIIPSEDSTSVEEDSAVQFDASCQTDLELPQLSVLQRKEYVELKKENADLKAEMTKLTLKREGEYLTEDFFVKEENWDILKLYTG